ncbi:energy-coupled thiamine transporter ThiT [Peribacillus glennii]|uniref:Energy-coupled thiamine transporter ThiT n=1 Tax=Peribacillus glennii TaxID=2303991 RepID=A0A372L980_9BACI|nr:energy-coupled thiamine transporter ThiT [Peribacillus glennii]RFU62057.1 energy-coupled thiamine transporter ThiT [Peribacillus glennii]
MNKKTLFLVEVAIFAALAFLLDLVSNFIFSRIWPQGGSVSIAMVPVFLMAYRWGLKGGLTTGFLLGLLQVVSGTAWIGHPVQGFIDYFLAFTVVGFAGVFAKQVTEGYREGNKGRGAAYATIGMFIGSFLRFLCHYVSGIVFFGSENGQPVAIFSLTYNGTYMLASFVLCTAVLILLYSAASRVLIKNVHHAK